MYSVELTIKHFNGEIIGIFFCLYLNGWIQENCICLKIEVSKIILIKLKNIAKKDFKQIPNKYLQCAEELRGDPSSSNPCKSMITCLFMCMQINPCTRKSL